MAQPLGEISLSASVDAAATASLAATLDPIAASITVRARNRDGVFPLWWRAYVQRILAEQEVERIALREASAVTGDGWCVLPQPYAQGVAFADDPEGDIEFLAAMLPWLRRADCRPSPVPWRTAGSRR